MENTGFGHDTYLMVSQFPQAGSKIQSHFHGIWPGRGRRPCRRKEAKPSPTAQLCREFTWGWGWCPGGSLSLALRRCPSLPGGLVFQGQGLAFLLSLGELAAANKSPAICTHQSCLLTGRLRAVFHGELHTALS